MSWTYQTGGALEVLNLLRVWGASVEEMSGAGLTEWQRRAVVYDWACCFSVRYAFIGIEIDLPE